MLSHVVPTSYLEGVLQKKACSPQPLQVTCNLYSVHLEALMSQSCEEHINLKLMVMK